MSILDFNYPSIVKPNDDTYSIRSKKDSLKSLDGTITYYPDVDYRTDISEFYKVRFLSPRYKDKQGRYRYDMVTAPLSEEFVEDVQSNWQNAVTLDNDILDKILQVAVNKSTKSAIFYRQVWDGNEPFRGKFIITLIAVKDAYEEVYRPTRALQRMASPGAEGILGDFGRVLTPPIPSAQDPSNGVTIGVGRQFDYVGAILESVNFRPSGKQDLNGYYTRGDVEVSFRLVNPVTKDDLQ